MSFLELNGITKKYKGSDKPCIENLDLYMEEGEIIVILGPSGCGKTTTLKIIAGLEHQDSGSVMIDGMLMDGKPAEKRPIAMVFQKPLLFKNMTVEQNVNFAPRVKSTLKKEELKAKTEEMLKLVDLEGYDDRKATQLSGGQEQRVSLARALITKPKLLLLDEPFSALDAELRVTMRKAVKNISKNTGQSMLFVTHDQQEAVSIADYIALMMDGKILQYGPPEDFYARPVSKKAASFFGWMNFIPATQNGTKVTCQLGEFENANFVQRNGDVLLTIRPESAIISEEGKFEGKVTSATYKGARSEYTIECNGIILEININSRHMYIGDDLIRFDLDPSTMWTVEKEDDDVVEETVEEKKKHRFYLPNLGKKKNGNDQ